MSQFSGNWYKPLLIWSIANILGAGALALLSLISPFLMSIKGVFVSTLSISIPFSVAQWLALRRIAKISSLWILTIPIGLVLSILLLRSMPALEWLNLDDESIAGLSVGFLIIGFFVGIPQWLILRHQFSGALVWLFGSVLGFSAGIWIILVTNLINHNGFFAIVVVLLVYTVTTGLILSRLVAHHKPAPLETVGSA